MKCLDYPYSSPSSRLSTVGYMCNLGGVLFRLVQSTETDANTSRSSPEVFLSPAPPPPIVNIRCGRAPGPRRPVAAICRPVCPSVRRSFPVCRSVEDFSGARCIRLWAVLESASEGTGSATVFLGTPTALWGTQWDQSEPAQNQIEPDRNRPGRKWPSSSSRNKPVHVLELRRRRVGFSLTR